MATINASQDYDIIQTLTFTFASSTCKIRLFRGSVSAYTGTVKVRAGTSGAWSDLSVSGAATTFNVTNTTMQIAHDWNKSGNNYMTCSFLGQSSNLTGIAISQKASLSGTIGSYFMRGYAQSCAALTSLDVPDMTGATSLGHSFLTYYAFGCAGLTSLSVPNTSDVTTVDNSFMLGYAMNCTGLTSLSAPNISNVTSTNGSFMDSYASGCTNLTSLGIPDTSSITTVETNLMYYYANGCNALTTLVLPSVGWFATNSVAWNVPSARLNYLKGVVINSADLSGWQALTTSTAPNTLYLNYIRSAGDVSSLSQDETGTASSSIGFQFNLTPTKNINQALSSSAGDRYTLTFDNDFVTALSNSIGCQSNLAYSKLELKSITHSNLQPYIVVYRYRRTA